MRCWRAEATELEFWREMGWDLNLSSRENGFMSLPLFTVAFGT